MVEAVGRLFKRERSDLVDRLLRLAGGDVDLLREAIRKAANGAESADLGTVVAVIVQQRDKQGPLAAP